MGAGVSHRDLRLGRLYLPTFDSDPSESLGEALGADESGVAVAKRRPVPFALTLPLRGASADSNPYAAGARMRRQMRAMMSNTQYRLQAIYIAFAPDEELNGWLVPGSGELKYDANAGGVTTGMFQLELSSAYMVGHMRTHRPARRVELYDRRNGTTVKDALGIVKGTDWAAIAPLAITALPVGVTNPQGYLGQAVTVRARAGFDGVGYVVQGMQHGNIVSYEREESQQNRGDVVLYDRQGVAGLPEEGAGTNLAPNPGLSVSTAGWVASQNFNNPKGVLTRSTAQAHSGEASLQVVTDVATTSEGAELQLSGTFLKGVTYTASLYYRGAAGGEPVILAFGVSADNATVAGAASKTEWKRLTVTWTPSADRVAATVALQLNEKAVRTLFVDDVQVVQGAAAVAYFDGDTPGYVWRGTAGLSVSSIDPQNFGWEEVYGADQAQTAGDILVMTNQKCRLRWVAANSAFAVDAYEPTLGVWEEEGRVTLWDSAEAQDAYVQHTYVVPGGKGALTTVLEWTPERTMVKISTLRATGNITARLDTYISLQRGWTAPRFETYCYAEEFAEAGCQIRWTPNSASNYLVAAPSSAVSAGDDALFGWASSPGSVWSTLGEPWVTTVPVAGGGVVTIASLQELARVPRYVDNAAYGGGNRDSIAVAARFGEPQTANGLLYGYASMHLGFTQSPQTIAVGEAEASMVAGGTRVNEADAAASGGKAIKDTQAAETAVTAAVTTTALAVGKYGVWVRMRGTNGVMTTKVKAGFSTAGGTTTVVVAVAKTATYVWVYVGEATLKTVAASKLNVTVWGSTAEGAWLDRIVILPLESRLVTTLAAPTLDGVRDLAAMHLYDAQAVPELVER